MHTQLRTHVKCTRTHARTHACVLACNYGVIWTESGPPLFRSTLLACLDGMMLRARERSVRRAKKYKTYIKKGAQSRSVTKKPTGVCCVVKQRTGRPLQNYPPKNISRMAARSRFTIITFYVLVTVAFIMPCNSVHPPPHRSLASSLARSLARMLRCAMARARSPP